MKRYFGFLMAAVAAVFLQGCLGSGGSSAPPPNNVVVTAKDSKVVVTWDMVPGVQYWIFKANATGVTPQNCSSMPLCTTSINVTSPATISGLYNGYIYSFSINGRMNGGAGGAGSPSVQAIPRPAGATWTVGTAQGANALRGVAYGNGKFVAAGDGNTLLSSTDGITWAALTSPAAAGTNLSAVNYNASPARHFVAGAGGAILQSADAAVTWTSLTSNTTNPLYALTNNGTGFVVAVGAGGTITTTADSGTTWTVQNSGTANPLYGVTYGYDSTNGVYAFVAVGAAGTVRYSTDGVTWTTKNPTSNTAADLKSVTYGAAAGIFVAVGTGGTVISSTDGITWTPQTAANSTSPISSVSTATLNSVTYTAGRRFIAVNDAGNVFYSEYLTPAVWTRATVTPATASPIYSVTPGGLLDYSAVGAAGLNLYAD